MKTRTPVLVKSLVALAILQVLVLALRGDGPFRKRSASPAFSDVSPARADPTHAPSDLSAVVAADADGEEQPLGEGGPALVLVFDPECVHTHAVSALWRDWLLTADPDLRIVALSESPSAVAYASDAGWPVSVLTIRAEDLGSQARTVVNRTPWVFALDAHGNVVDDGLGSSVSQVASALYKARPNATR